MSRWLTRQLGLLVSPYFGSRLRALSFMAPSVASVRVLFLVFLVDSSRGKIELWNGVFSRLKLKGSVGCVFWLMTLILNRRIFCLVVELDRLDFEFCRLSSIYLVLFFIENLLLFKGQILLFCLPVLSSCSNIDSFGLSTASKYFL